MLQIIEALLYFYFTEMILLYEEHGKTRHECVILNNFLKRLQHSNNVLIQLGRMLAALVLNLENAENSCDNLINESVESLVIERLRADWAFTAMNFVVSIYPRLQVKSNVKACQITWNILRSFNIITRGVKRFSLLTHFLAGLHYHFKFQEVHTIGNEIIFYLTDRKLFPKTVEEHTCIAFAYLFMQEARRYRCKAVTKKYVELAYDWLIHGLECRFDLTFSPFTDDHFDVVSGRFIEKICKYVLDIDDGTSLCMDETERKVIESILNLKAADRRTDDKHIIEIWSFRYYTFCC